jgi:photosystem II stability/assembly factor-like uncharacterized protein
MLMLAAAESQWEKIAVPTQASLRGLSVVSEKVVWASGTEGTIIRTVDGGKSWSVMTVAGAEKLDFRGIRAFDHQNAVIISSGPAEKGQARIYRTTDGGKNWQQVFEEKRAGIFFDAVAFWDLKHGIVLSDPVEGKFALFTTDDGGVTWKQLPPAALPAALPNEGAFAASNSCLTVQGASNVWFATGGAKVARVFRSADRGKTWQVAETPMHPANASSGIFSLAFADANNGIAVGGDYQKPEGSDLPNVLRTIDGGKTWMLGESSNPSRLYLSSAAPISTPGSSGFVAVGTTGAFVVTKSRSRTSDVKLNAVATAGGDYIAETFWAVGPEGMVLRSYGDPSLHSGR